MKLRISVDGKTYEVDVEVAEDDRTPYAAGPVPYYAAASGSVPTPPPPVAVPSAPVMNVAEDRVCRSPISGVVVRVSTHVGQQIQINDPLLVLEAMKMETNITSPVSGKIKNISANVGDGVQVGQVLVEFE